MPGRIPRPYLSLREKRNLALKLLFYAPAQLLWNYVIGLPFAIASGISLRFFAFCAFYRFVLACLKPREIQFLTRPTWWVYEDWIERKRRACPDLADKLRRDVEKLPANEGSILWLGDRTTAKKFVLFLHGGGYSIPLQPGHMDWCWEAYIAVGLGTHAEVAVAILEYSLVPEGRYPRQLRQSIAALNHLLHSGVRPADLIVGGDSAGGNLACSLARHICQPCHLEIPPIILDGRLAGIFMVSPWLSGKGTAASFRENNYVDMISAKAIRNGTTALLHPRFPAKSKTDESDLTMAMPMDGDLSWVDDIGDATKSIYITGGQCEAFRDDIRSFSELVSCSGADVELLAEFPENEAHDFILLEGQIRRVGDATIRMRNWAAAQFGARP